MLPLMDMLIILSGISAAQAGLLRRYTNSTSQALQTVSGVAYDPAAGSSSLSLPPVEGITTLPFSLLVDDSTELPPTSSIVSSTVSDSLPIISSAASFKFEPWEPETSSTQSAVETAPISFWTFGEQRPRKTVTVTSTGYTTVFPSSQAIQSTSVHSSQQGAIPGQAQNTTCTTTQTSTWIGSIIYDPLPTTSTSAFETTSTSSTVAEELSPSSQTFEASSTIASTTSSAWNYPRPGESEASSTTASSQEGSKSSSLPSFGFDASAKLPEVVNESASATQSQQQRTASNTTSVPGITIVPQNPSVIYITVTEPGSTTTVTA